MPDDLLSSFAIMFVIFALLAVGSVAGLVFISTTRRRNKANKTRANTASKDGGNRNQRQQADPSMSRAERRAQMRQNKEASAELDAHYDEFTAGADGDSLPSVEDLLGLGGDDEGDDSLVDIFGELAPAAPAPPTPRFHRTEPDAVNVKLVTGDEAQAQELISILRDERDGRLIVLMGEAAYRSLSEAGDTKKQFTKVMKELGTVIMKPDDNPPVKPAPEPPDVPQAAQAPAPARPEQPTPQPATAPPPKRESGAPLPGDLPDMSIDSSMSNIERGRFGQLKIKDVEKAPEINIAKAIEEYLQYKISQTPQFQRRGISIKPALNGGVRIEADGKGYDFVDEIEDEAVRNFVQTAINEWQDRH